MNKWMIWGYPTHIYIPQNLTTKEESIHQAMFPYYPQLKDSFMTPWGGPCRKITGEPQWITKKEHVLLGFPLNKNMNELWLTHLPSWWFQPL